MATFDLDLLHLRDRENVSRILAALKELDATVRFRPGVKMLPDESHLMSPEHQLLMTRCGPLDLLGSIGNGRVYGDLADRTIRVEVAEGISVRVLELATLIEIKEELGREKDRAALPVLKRTLEEKRRGKSRQHP